ncbi:sporulation protein [Streptomyces sp. NPDC006798]|uniref:sporulation protein n=1 Tax=Streptomyces sp. NPDC006798 TaxID=3155462 RepID=UPI0033FCE98E
MGFRRLFGRGNPDEAIEVDTQIHGPVYPGGTVKGEVLLRGGSRDTPVRGVRLQMSARYVDYRGEERDYEFDSTFASPSGNALRRGEELRLAFSERLPWETPVSELGGRALGVVLSVKSTYFRDWDDDGTDVDNDLLHVSALPLHEVVMDAFAEQGYFCDQSHVMDSYIPDVEMHRGYYQTFVLACRAPETDRPELLEVVFLTNQVGAMAHVRRADLNKRDWREKPPVRRFPVAHHEVGHADLGVRVRKALDEIALMESM